MDLHEEHEVCGKSKNYYKYVEMSSIKLEELI